MADETTNMHFDTVAPEAPQQDEAVAENDNTVEPHDESMPEPIVVPMPEIAAQEAVTIGDENMEPRKPSVEIHEDSVPAQVMGKPAPAVETVPVHETFVATDTVIIDTSDPLAVQIPDAGRGNASLPIHAISGPTVEQFFAKHASEKDES